MELSVFIVEFQNLLRREQPLTPTTRLEEIQEWDSMAIMETITWFGTRFNRSILFDDFLEVETVADVAALCEEREQ